MVVISKYSKTTVHSPAMVFEQWATPGSWPRWDTEVKEVSFTGQAALHAQGRMKPVKGPASAFEITVFEPDAVLTTASKLPGARLLFEHVVRPVPEGAEVCVVVSVEGPLAFVWARVLRGSLAQSARSSVTGLIAYLDAR